MKRLDTVRECAYGPIMVTDEDWRIGEAVRFYRQHLGWRQEDLAQEADVPQQVISNVERGRYAIAASTLVRLARGLRVHPAWLLELADLVDADRVDPRLNPKRQAIVNARLGETP